MAEKEENRTCVRCGYVADGKDKYCMKCGAPLINQCTDDGGPISKGCKKINPPDAAYCSSCGEPTTFLKAGLLSGYPPQNPESKSWWNRQG